MSSGARTLAAVVAIVAWASLAGQFVLALETNGTALATLWSLLRYFTILTGVLVALTYTWMALTGRRAEPRWTAALTLWIIIVGVVYHALLARYGKTGLDFWADHGSHTVTPILATLWWFAYARHIRFRWRLAVIWLAYPLLYLGYALLRGASDGKYPYFFVDVSRFPLSTIAMYCTGLCIAFWLAGLLMIAIARVRAE